MSDEPKPEPRYKAVRVSPETHRLIKLVCLNMSCMGRADVWSAPALIEYLVKKEAKRRGLSRQKE